MDYEIDRIKNEMEEKVNCINEKMGYFISIDFDNHKYLSDIRVYNRMIKWLNKVNDELERILYDDDLSMVD